ncbi:MAG: hypothetical protein EZS26_000790 [Candidatus Ordinivivax streblomastigis]|uniref:Uncharacterized protein n=1 Tax=Candidatus Ordinivivax streblomastigis TaxID=2540710 RepID=A0A5M8P3W0_9BACT|nr:MAG: hypothetical protein EZS26_000790 [Candidatus Ordinivivax streblomastigis]
MEKRITSITDGINRRFFSAVDALVTMGRAHSLEALCKEFALHPPRYREMRLTYGVTPNPNSKPSRYVNIEMDAIYHLCSKYSVSAEWLMLGRGKIFK